MNYLNHIEFFIKSSGSLSFLYSVYSVSLVSIFFYLIYYMNELFKYILCFLIGIILCISININTFSIGGPLSQTLIDRYDELSHDDYKRPRSWMAIVHMRTRVTAYGMSFGTWKNVFTDDSKDDVKAINTFNHNGTNYNDMPTVIPPGPSIYGPKVEPYLIYADTGTIANQWNVGFLAVGRNIKNEVVKKRFLRAQEFIFGTQNKFWIPLNPDNMDVVKNTVAGTSIIIPLDDDLMRRNMEHQFAKWMIIKPKNAITQ